jgi:TniQ
LTVWNIRPAPRPQESISSWLIRIAAAKGTKHHSLIDELCPGVPFWTRDGDLMAPPALLAALAEHTGTPLARVRSSTLRSLEGVLDETISGLHQSPMITPLGVRHRTRLAFGQHFCSECLAEPDPYLRLTWRLQMFPTCTRHGRILRDCCPACGGTYQPHRRGFRSCAHCCFDLGAMHAEQADGPVLELQRHNERVLVGGAVVWPYLRGLHPLPFFALQLALLRAVVSPRWGDRLRRGLEPWLGPLAFTCHGTTPTLRSLSMSSVHDALRAVELLLRGWPYLFVGICSDAEAWATWIVPEEARTKTPFVLRHTLDTFLRPGSAPRVG